MQLVVQVCSLNNQLFFKNKIYNHFSSSMSFSFYSYIFFVIFLPLDLSPPSLGANNIVPWLLNITTLYEVGSTWRPKFNSSMQCHYILQATHLPSPFPTKPTLYLLFPCHLICSCHLCQRNLNFYVVILKFDFVMWSYL